MATAAAAVIAQARREIQHHFFAADAVRADRAVGFTPSNPVERRQFDTMRAAGIIRQAEDGRFWLDVVAYDMAVQARYRRVRIMLVVMATLTAMLLVISALKGG